MFKTVVLVMFAACLLGAPSTDLAAQTDARSLIARMIEAHGGTEQLSGITTSVREGNFVFVSQGGVKGDVKMVNRYPDKSLTVLEFDFGDTISQGFDGKVAWLDYPRAGGVQILPEYETGEMKRAALGFGALLEPAEHGIEYVYLGPRFDGGTEYHVLEQVFPDETKVSIYVDATSFLIYKTVITDGSSQSPVVRETFYSDYREVHGIVDAHRIVTFHGGQEETVTVLNRITYNAGLDADVFQLHEERFAKEELIADARELSAIIESTHPDPYQQIGGRIAYHRQFQHLLYAIPDGGMTRNEFKALLRPFIAAMGDSHTTVSAEHALMENRPGGIPLRFKATASSLVVTGVPGTRYEGLLGATLVAVEGVSIEELGERLARLRPIENRHQLAWHFATNYLWNGPYLKELLPDWEESEGLHVKLRNPSGDIVETKFLSSVDVSAMIEPESRIVLPEPDESGMAFGMMGAKNKIAFLRIDHMKYYRESFECRDGLGLQSMPEDELRAIPSATEFFRSLATAMKDAGSEALILDVRRNDGGDALMSDILLYFLYGKKAAQRVRTNTITRVSKMYLDARKKISLDDLNSSRPVPLVEGDYDFTEDYSSEVLSRGFSMDQAFAKTPTFLGEWSSGAFEKYYSPDHVLVLTSPQTFSAGFLVALHMHRAGATLLGTPPGQAPNAAGNIIEWSLTRSGVNGWVSQSYALNYPDDSHLGRELPVQYPLTLELLSHYDFDPNAEILYAMDLLADMDKKGP